SAAQPQETDIQTRVQAALGNLLGDTNGNGTPGELTDVRVSGDLINNVEIDVRLHKDMDKNSAVATNANLGLDSLPVKFSVDGGARTAFGFDYELAIGFNVNNQAGFSIDTSKLLPSGHQLDIGVDAWLTDAQGNAGQFNASATLGFFITATAT